MTNNLDNRTHKKLEELVDQFEANQEQILKLKQQLESAESRDKSLNAEICLLCELLGYHPEGIADAIHRKRERAA